MPKYLIQGSYSPEALEAVKSGGGSRRRDATAELIRGLGGEMESFYYAFGDSDTYVTADLPNNEAAAAWALAVNAGGQVALKTVVLLTPEEVDAACHIASAQSRRVPW
jgi:uncharacterized protein with GYD domain